MSEQYPSQPPQPQPGQWSGQPQYAPPPKKSRKGCFIGGCLTLLILAGIVIAVIAVVANSASDTLNEEHTVTYKVTGAGPGDITYATDSSGSSSQAGAATLPWSKEVKAKGLTAGMSVLAQNGMKSKGGAISCEVLVDGKSVKKATASGVGAIASCVVP